MCKYNNKTKNNTALFIIKFQCNNDIKNNSKKIINNS
jgi:hypothetical protein